MMKNQEAMKKYMKQEVDIVNNIVERLNNQTLPEKMREIEDRISEATTNSQSELNNCLNFVTDSIKTFKDRVDFFATDIAVT